MDNSKEFRCISFCTGYAGIELGLRTVIPNLRTVTYVEVEAFACANLVAKIEEGKLDAAPIWTDIKTFNGEPFRDRIHLITGGYPCQPFSVAGKRQGTADPRHLWPYIEEQIRTIRPLFCFFENVSGHLTIGFSDVYRSLRNLGYSVEAGLFSASECGLNHQRKRLYILANAQGEHWNELPNAPSRKKFRQSIWEQQFRRQNMPADDSLWGEQGKYVFDPRICRRDDGCSGPVDRLHLLGNGVVPQCAAKAWEYLTNKIE